MAKERLPRDGDRIRYTHGGTLYGTVKLVDDRLGVCWDHLDGKWQMQSLTLLAGCVILPPQPGTDPESVAAFLLRHADG